MMTAPDITGVWRLLFCDTEFKDSGERVPLLGADPIGFLVLTPGGRMMVVLTASEMTTPILESAFIFLPWPSRQDLTKSQPLRGRDPSRTS